MLFTVVPNEDCETYSIYHKRSKVAVVASDLKDDWRDLLIRNGTIQKTDECYFKVISVSDVR